MVVKGLKKQKKEKIQVNNHKQVRSSRQNDKLEQWVMDNEVKVVVVGSILFSK